jgi:hypothetical protein
MWRGTAAARLLLRACASSPVLQQHTQQLLPPLQSASRPAILLPVTRWIQTKAALRSHGGGGGGGGKLAVYVCFSPFSFPPFFFDCHHFQTIDDVRYLFSPLSLAPHMPSILWKAFGRSVGCAAVFIFLFAILSHSRLYLLLACTSILAEMQYAVLILSDLSWSQTVQELRSCLNKAATSTL